jgi:hypothetical protein
MGNDRVAPACGRAAPRDLGSRGTCMTWNCVWRARGVPALVAMASGVYGMQSSPRHLPAYFALRICRSVDVEIGLPGHEWLCLVVRQRC